MAVKEKKPNLVFLMENKLKVGRETVLKHNLKFEGCFRVDPIGRSGGMLLSWQQEMRIEINNYSQRNINSWCLLRMKN